MELSDRIKRVVVLMLENRSFDHMLGFMRGPGYEVDGLFGTEFNYVNPSDPKSAKVVVSDDAPFVPDLNPSPGHDVRDALVQIYGGATLGEPTNSGFVYDYAQNVGVSTAQAAAVMRSFAPSKLPVLSTLAKEFAVCDRWFSSLPGPTWPNRLFVHCATSGGYIDNNPHRFAMRTIFENISDVGKQWRVYFHDTPQSFMLANLRNARYLKNFEQFEAFRRDCLQGQLPDYSFIEPRYLTVGSARANDQHPDHGVLLGEQLIADVYNNLRGAPQWGETLLVLLWDEHGGFYDHVPPPKAVRPDDCTSPEFDFSRLGVRVPALLVSPWIAAGSIDRTVYDHSSVAATLKSLFSLREFLTKRDEAANTFGSVCSLQAPRTDAPQNLAPASPPLTTEFEERFHAVASQVRAPSDLQRSLVALANEISPETAVPPSSLHSEVEAAVHIQQATARLLS